VKRASYVAALVAIPIEVINLWLILHSPLDVGSPAGTSKWVRIIFTQSGFIHWPGFVLYGLLDSRGIHSDGLLVVICLVAGYIDTFLIVLALVLSFRWLRIRA